MVLGVYFKVLKLDSEHEHFLFNLNMYSYWKQSTLCFASFQRIVDFKRCLWIFFDISYISHREELVPIVHKVYTNMPHVCDDYNDKFFIALRHRAITENKYDANILFNFFDLAG